MCLTMRMTVAENYFLPNRRQYFYYKKIIYIYINIDQDEKFKFKNIEFYH